MADTSSSEIEFITRPSAAAAKTPSPVKPRRSGRDRRAPRPKDDLAAPAAETLRLQNGAAGIAKPTRRSAGTARTTDRRMGNVEIGVDELDDRDDDDDDDDDEETLTDLRMTKTTASRQASTSKVTLDAFEPKRAASKPRSNPRASRDTLSPNPVRDASKTKATSASTLDVPRTSAPARKSMSRSPAPPSSSTGVPNAPQASISAPIASTSRAPARSSTSTNTTAPRLAPRAKPKRNSSSDEADDFFARAKKPNKPALRVPGRATAAASATATKKVSRGSSPIAAKSGPIQIDSSSEDEYDKMKRGSASAATGTSTAPARALDDGSTDETDTSSVRSGPGHSDSDDGAGSDPENLFSSSAVRPKNLNLPAWARGGIARLSGADVERLQKGPGKNRKRKRLDDDSDDEEEPQSRGTGAAKKTGLNAFDGMGGSLWDQQLAATAAAKAAATAAAASGSGMGKGTTTLNDYTFDSDDSLEAEFAIYEKPEPHVPLAPPPGSPTKKRAQKAATGRSESLSTSPVRRGKSREDTSDSRRSRSATDRSPSQPSPRKRTAPLVISSGDEDEATVAARQKARPAFASTDSDEDGESYLDRIRSMVGRSASAEHRSPSVPVSGAAVTQDDEAPATKDVGEPVTIRLRMVFDPTRNVPDAVKRAYEREDTFTIASKESFASLFYEVAIRRTIARDDLVITQVRDPGSSKPLTLARQNQVYEFGTPESLGLVTGQDVEMRGYTRHVWSVVKEQEKQQRLKATDGDREGDDDDDDDEELNAAAAAAAARRSAGPQRGFIDLDELPSSDGATTSANPTSEAAADDLDGLFPLTMRGSKTESLSLAVKPTTTMAQLVKAYCKHFKLPQQGVTIEFEGEALESTRTIEDVKEEYDLDGEETFDIIKAA